ncbi:ABC transporter permease subunit [Paenibacillus sp. LMG 31456]|uniref:ABC transporter permease subunit n=1 Tax=Paenibacillus foliorum TaxID=2654974 RepID=A0A972GM33_9BACL|nr:ABC transporter permease [Paenibacillus foliorum]NOU92773.1 ABC transporter permease subunit [Paenibacillus foliorum]
MSRQRQLAAVDLEYVQKPVFSEKKQRIIQRITRFVLGALVPVLLLIAWQILGDLGIISSLLFPTPLRIFQAGIRLIQTGELYDNMKISLIRAISGFLMGGALGLAFGVLVGLFRSSERTLDPTVQMIRMVPHLAIAPLFILWFGIGETAKILLIAKGAFFPLYINTFIGIRSADNKLFDVTRVLGFSKWKQIIRLILPAALPNILLGVRISLGVAWLGLVVAELMGSTAGIGYLMSDARQFSKTPIVFVGILIFAAFGILSDSLVRLLERKWLSWRESYNGR